jgi:hypothetical protein
VEACLLQGESQGVESLPVFGLFNPIVVPGRVRDTMLIKCKVHDGLIDSEKLAEIQTRNGMEQVAVSGVFIEDGALHVSHVGSEGGNLLVELPVESASGNWRVWVSPDQVEQPHGATL